MFNTTCNIANFNCTFNVNSECKPMLDYFESIIYEALANSKITRNSVKNGEVTATYFLIDVKLIEIRKGEYALVGKHVKRAYLRINRDITPDGTVTEIGEIKNSAPTSTFILLLRNHRVIYFKNDLLGSPDIRAFNVTIREIVEKFVRGKRNNLINELRKSDFMYNGVHYSNVTEFKENILNKMYPASEINIVPIESKDLLEKKFKEIYKIDELKLYVYKLNSENQYNTYLDSISSFASQIGTTKIEQKATNVEKVQEVKTVISSSGGGKFDYKITAHTRKNEKLTLTPKDVSESIPVEYNEIYSDEKIIDSVFSEVEDKEQVKSNNSEENLEKYISKKNIFEKLKEIFSK
ncbi:hypothetical protein PMX22_16330 [Clostridium butyricum]|uniref:hypothetical protein n=1 Tax=Clostridium butyricum TaxID=1492 RepID=UPI00232BBD2A|nr:hypothetical protein [Clostridium butyricum]MDB2161360.1 hypothetical protein [Clostridium butyricum]